MKKLVAISVLITINSMIISCQIEQNSKITDVIPNVNLQFTPEKKYNKLYLFGSFNVWNRKDIAMIDEDADGTFEAGVYGYNSRLTSNLLWK